MNASDIMLLVWDASYNTAQRHEIFYAYVMATDLQLAERALMDHGIASPGEASQAMRTAQRTLERLGINQARHLARLLTALLHAPVAVDL